MTVKYKTDVADPRVARLAKATQDSTQHQKRLSTGFSDVDLQSSDPDLQDYDQCEVQDDSEDEWIDVSDARDFARLYKGKEDLKAGKERQKTKKGAKLEESWELLPVPGKDRATYKDTNRKTAPCDEDQGLHLLFEAMTLEERKYPELEPPTRVFAPHKLSPDLDYTPERPIPGDASRRSTFPDLPSEVPQVRLYKVKPAFRTRTDKIGPASRPLRRSALRKAHMWEEFSEADKRSKLEDSSSSLYTHAS